jgi:hypothetical protein
VALAAWRARTDAAEGNNEIDDRCLFLLDQLEDRTVGGWSEWLLVARWWAWDKPLT